MKINKLSSNTTIKILQRAIRNLENEIDWLVVHFGLCVVCKDRPRGGLVDLSLCDKCEEWIAEGYNGKGGW